MQALNEILDHALLPNASRFTAEMLQSVTGFEKKNRTEPTGPDLVALDPLRVQFAQPQQDLHDLVQLAWPGRNFSVAPDA